MTPQADPFVGRVNWLRVIAAGLAAGLFINIFEYVGHRVLLNDAWTAAFRALGKTPTGWGTFIPTNFFVGLLMVWFFARLRLHHDEGAMSALKSGLAIWAVFWFIPMMSLIPMNLFPNKLLVSVIALGFVEVNLAALFGAWLYNRSTFV